MAKTTFGKIGTDYTRSYPRFLGVDLSGSGSEISKTRMAYSENMYRDYSSEDSSTVESVPGYRRLHDFGKPIRAIHRYKHPEGGDFLLVHASDDLFLFKGEGQTPTRIAQVADVKSRGFQCGSSFYLLDGEGILVVDKSGTAKRVGAGISPYVPTRYYCGKELEQRNLLTPLFYEEYLIEDPMQYSYGSKELKYAITDPTEMTCAVVGCSEGVPQILHIPSVVKIGEHNYRVAEISDWAFAYAEDLTTVRIGENVKRIGKFAFRGCTKLITAYTPKSLIEIDNAAFADCARMSEIYLRDNLSTLGINVFSGCISLAMVHYEGTAEELSALPNSAALSAAEIIEGSFDRTVTLGFPVISEAQTIYEITVGDQAMSFDLNEDAEGRTVVTVELSDPGEICGKQVKLQGEAKPLLSSFGEPEGTERIDSAEAILGCTMAELFDGRVFLCGNPALPNTVFYSSVIKGNVTDPLYFGSYDYFSDGVGSFGISSLLSVRDSLAVFKSKDDGSGSIFYHKREATGDDLVSVIYPKTYVHSGLCAKTNAVNFLDDPVFLCPLGLCALTMKAINYERSVECRSHNVNSLLLSKDLGEVCLTEWCGYLAVCIGDTVLLADSRQRFSHRSGSTEYEWFVIKGIGSYENATRVYRYSSEPRSGFLVPETPDAEFDGMICSEQTEAGEVTYYGLAEDGRYLLYPTEQMKGGTFYPASAFLGVDDLLYFGTEGGVLMIFNNDMRGVAPPYLREKADFDPVKYKQKMGRRIHPYYYSFDRHAPRYVVTTAKDDCDVPHLTKSTSKNSLVMRCASYTSSRIAVEIYTEREAYKELTFFPAGEWDFAELDFSAAVMDNAGYNSLPLSEKEKGWVEKQINVYSDEFLSPIALCSLTYRYKIKGRIKPR